MRQPRLCHLSTHDSVHKHNIEVHTPIIAPIVLNELACERRLLLSAMQPSRRAGSPQIQKQHRVAHTPRAFSKTLRSYHVDLLKHKYVHIRIKRMHILYYSHAVLEKLHTIGNSSTQFNPTRMSICFTFKYCRL